MEFLGIRLLGFNPVTGQRVLLTVALILIAVVSRSVGQGLTGRVTASGDRANRIDSWARQRLSLLIALVSVIGLVSIWFDNPANRTTAVGLVTAGLAFALQKVVTSVAMAREVLAKLDEFGIASPRQRSRSRRCPTAGQTQRMIAWWRRSNSAIVGPRARVALYSGSPATSDEWTTIHRSGVPARVDRPGQTLA